MHIQIRTILIDNVRLLFIIEINPKSTSSKRRRVELDFMQNFHKTSYLANIWFSKFTVQKSSQFDNLKSKVQQRQQK